MTRNTKRDSSKSSSSSSSSSSSVSNTRGTQVPTVIYVIYIYIYIAVGPQWNRAVREDAIVVNSSNGMLQQTEPKRVCGEKKVMYIRAML